MSEVSLQAIQGLLRAGKTGESLRLVEQYTEKYPGDASGWLLRGTILLELGRPVIAAGFIREACTLEPGNRAMEGRVCIALIQAGLRLEAMSRYVQAEAMYREAIELQPELLLAHLNLGRLLSTVGSYQEARKHLKKVLDLQPRNADAVATLALSYEYEGDYRHGLELLRSSLDTQKIAAPVALAYAVMSMHTGEQAKAAGILECLVEDSSAGSHLIDINFSLGKLYDQLGKFDQAFEQYEAGNRRLGYCYDKRRTLGMFEKIASAFGAEQIDSINRATNRSEIPVFIVGMPRSGTTLVEQILASHPDVHGAGELDDILRVVSSMGGPVPGDADVARLDTPTLDRAAKDYLDVVSGLSDGERRVVDKMPHNFLALGYIDLLFPGSRVIHCVRDPRDTCLSVWFQRMTGNHPYTADLGALADYYQHYRQLMKHWQGVLRVPILEVHYEHVVQDTEHWTRELIDFCGLHWDDRCLRFYENKRTVSTPTYDEVRQPVHNKSIGRWKRYKSHLHELAGLAEPAD